MSTSNKKEWRKEHIKTNKTPNEITTCLQTVTSHVMWSQKTRALSREQIV